MNPETVLTMCTEKSIDINYVPGGSGATFTSEDAKHALAHMRPDAFNYCMYVYLLNDDDLGALAESVILHIAKEHKEIAFKKDNEAFIRLCRMACVEQTKPAGKIKHSERYNHLDMTRAVWRYQWQYIFVYAENYLNELRQEVTRHIYYITKEEETDNK